MNIWGEKTTICIQVNSHYIYYAKIVKIGTPENKIGDFSMWGWIYHLRDKNWWNNEIEKSFIKLANNMFK
jgi:hypothetical protein